MTAYADFLATKAVSARPVGLEGPLDLNPHLKPFQHRIVEWALERGRAAVFADTGLGKTLIELAWARAVAAHTGRPTLILTPLAVAPQTVGQGDLFGERAVYARSQSEVETLDCPIIVANYEMLDAFDLERFGGVALDESSLLKNYVGKTRQRLQAAFAGFRFKLCATATPSPNDTVELGTHAEFLEVMTSGEMLTRWFSNDTSRAQTFRLKAHGERDFWRWVASWAVCIRKPSDLPNPDGEPYSDEGYILPPLTVLEHVVKVDQTGGLLEDGALFRNIGTSATDLHREKRLTVEARAARVAELVAAEPHEPWAIWCDTDYEADALQALLPEALEVRGSQPRELKEERLTAFSEGQARLLITKPRVAGLGMNWQHCVRTAFVGLSYSFEQVYQALRRFWRYGQNREVIAHLVTAETEAGVRESIKAKTAAHTALQDRMVAAMREAVGDEGRRLVAHIGPARAGLERGQDWELHLGDCVEVVSSLETRSVHLSIHSPPFSNLYIYSPSWRDMGNYEDDAQFFEHYGYLIPELLRVTLPGRLACVHVKNLPVYKSREGYSGLRDFRGDVIRAFQAARREDGTRWSYHSEVCIWTDPVREMQRTKAQGLLYKQLRQDSSHSRQGMPEYLLMFRKWTPECDAPEPVTHTTEDFPLELWQNVASPVWFDIDRTDVLNARVAREDADEKHLAPLQLEVIRRCVRLWSNPGDLVLSPFAGIGSEGVVALEQGRRFVGVELSEKYHRLAAQHLKRAESERASRLFPDLELEVTC